MAQRINSRRDELVTYFDFSLKKSVNSETKEIRWRPSMIIDDVITAENVGAG